MKGDRWFKTKDKLIIPNNQYVLEYKYYGTYRIKPFYDLSKMKAFITLTKNEAKRRGLDVFQVIEQREYSFTNNIYNEEKQ